MRILVLGGTAWLGDAVVRAALKMGHTITCVARGNAVPKGASVVNVDRDRDDALASVATHRWDAVVDVATEPGHVRRAARDLSGVAGRFVFVSSANVYAFLADDNVNEDGRLHEPLVNDVMSSPEEYGPAKVAGEEAVLAAFGIERSSIVRPGLIGGPGDPTGRSSYWPLRFARPSNPTGRVLVPDVADQATSVIDVRDLAAWIVRLAEGHTVGTFNTVGNPISFGDHLAAARAAALYTGMTVCADPLWLRSHGVGQWMGARSLPLWLTEETAVGLNSLSNQRARSAGMTLRPLSETLTDTLAWAQQNHIDTVTGAGLTDDEERRLLSLL